MPSTHDIAVSTEYLSKATYHHIRPREHVDIQKIANRFVDHHGEPELVRKATDPYQVRGAKERVARKFTEKCWELFSIPTPTFEVI